jgi:hypothetical protein
LKTRAPRSDKGKKRAKRTKTGGKQKGGKATNSRNEEEDEGEGEEEEEEEEDDDDEGSEDNDDRGRNAGNEDNDNNEEESQPPACMPQITCTHTSAALAPGVGSELVAAFGVASSMAPDTSAQLASDTALLFPPSNPVSHGPLNPLDIDWNGLQDDMESLYPLLNSFQPSAHDTSFLPPALGTSFPLLALNTSLPALTWPRLPPNSSEDESGIVSPVLTTSNGRMKRKAKDDNSEAPAAKRVRSNVENAVPAAKKPRKERSDKGKKWGATVAMTVTPVSKPCKAHSDKGKKRAKA